MRVKQAILFETSIANDGALRSRSISLLLATRSMGSYSTYRRKRRRFEGIELEGLGRLAGSIDA